MEAKFGRGGTVIGSAASAAPAASVILVVVLVGAVLVHTVSWAAAATFIGGILLLDAFGSPPTSNSK